MNIEWLLLGIISLFLGYYLIKYPDKVKELNKNNFFSPFHQSKYMSDKDYNLWVRFIGSMLLISGVIAVIVFILGFFMR
ncbi:MAG: hypothetical protein ACI4GW_00325 [Lachnospiraceae bacterium]